MVGREDKNRNACYSDLRRHPNCARLIVAAMNGPGGVSRVHQSGDAEIVFKDLRRYSRSVWDRTKASVDELGRVLDLSHSEKANRKYEEHVRTPAEFVERYRDQIRVLPTRQRPLCNDITETLRDLNGKVRSLCRGASSTL
jgi:hypothetical protein